MPAVVWVGVALVVLDGLTPGSDDPYEVRLDGVPVWPQPGMPPSRIRTLDPAREPRFAFGTCRTTGSHDEVGNRAHGVDASPVESLDELAAAVAEPVSASRVRVVRTDRQANVAVHQRLYAAVAEALAEL